jgi:hemerythrin
MGFTWTPRLSVGVDAIDEQHRELFRRVNELLSAISARQGSAQVLSTLGFLGEYVVSHFDDEVRLMHETAYPGRAEHLAEHGRFNDAFRRLRAAFARSGSDASLAAQVERELCDWLQRHVMETDRKLGEWLAERGLTGHPLGKPKSPVSS